MCVVQWDGLWRWQPKFEIWGGERGVGRGGKWGEEGGGVL